MIIDIKTEIEKEIKILNNISIIMDRVFSKYANIGLSTDLIHQETILFNNKNQKIRLRKERISGITEPKYYITTKEILKDISGDDKLLKCRKEYNIEVEQQLFDNMVIINSQLFGEPVAHYKMDRTVHIIKDEFSIERCHLIENLNNKKYIYDKPFIEIEQLSDYSILKFLRKDLGLGNKIIKDIRASNRSLLSISATYDKFNKQFESIYQDLV